MFLQVVTSKLLNKQIIHLSALIHYDEQIDSSIIPLGEELYKLDMDLTKDDQIELFIKCFEA